MLKVPNKSVGPSRAEGPSVARAARIPAKNIFISINIYIYIDEGVRPVAWQQCKHSLFDVRERESCQAATGCETGNLQLLCNWSKAARTGNYKRKPLPHNGALSCLFIEG